jgi:Fe-S cluster biosynthesis and repair protein YggX
MLINEYRLNLLDPQARKFLQEQMEQFLFGTGAGPEAIPNYVPPQN